MPKFRVSVSFDLESGHDLSKVSEEELRKEIEEGVASEVREWTETWFGGEASDFSFEIESEQEIQRERTKDIIIGIAGALLFGYVFWKQWQALPPLHSLFPTLF